MTAKEQFEAFHERNPHIYAELRDLALKVKEQGYTRFSIRPLYERLRWRRQFEVNDNPERLYKLNDCYTRFYSIKLMEEDPELDGFFTLRAPRCRDGRYDD